MKKAMNKNNFTGVTLLETLVVLVILSLLIAVSLPAYYWAEQHSLRTSANKLAVHCREARYEAIVAKQNCNIVFYPLASPPRYKLEYPDEHSWVVLPEGVRFFANNFPSSLGRGPTLYFRPTGAPNRGGHVGLIDKKGRKLYIIVTPATGRVRISHKPPD